MESIIFEDSPLAQYLEGQGEHEWTSPRDCIESTSPRSTSFAPRGKPTVYAKSRRKLPPALKLDVSQSEGALARLHTAGSRAFNSHLGRAENARFLEQFRYTIIASQLLSDTANPLSHNPLFARRQSQAVLPSSNSEQRHHVTAQGVLLTASSAFALVWSLNSARTIGRTHSSLWGMILMLSIVSISVIVIYAFLRRQWLHYLRNQAVDCAIELTANAQSFDAATSASIMLVQEVELVSRGYRLSTPLPPISRLEEQSQKKRCVRLRRALKDSISSMLLPHAQAYDSMKPHAVELDLEKYCDIYEISRMDKQEVEDLLESKVLSADDAETLKALKLVSQKMQLARKLFLCGLLALDADGGKSDFTRWTVAIDMMRILSTISADATIRLESILSEEERSIAPPSPNLVTSPGKERVKTQVRKLASLSQGIRCLQAKMHVLREESDRALDEPDQVSELGTSLMAQYDSIGADLKSLTQEWEDGRIALANNIDKNERRLSLSPAALLSPRSPAMSLSGLTAVGGSPTDALKVLNGDYESSRSADATSSDEEVFEAIALPRQRSSLTREERIAKMKEDRIRQAVVREKADANTHMLRELETVIKLRPRGRTTGRNTSV